MEQKQQPVSGSISWAPESSSMGIATWGSLLCPYLQLGVSRAQVCPEEFRVATRSPGLCIYHGDSCTTIPVGPYSGRWLCVTACFIYFNYSGFPRREFTPVHSIVTPQSHSLQASSKTHSSQARWQHSPTTSWPGLSRAPAGSLRCLAM